MATELESGGDNSASPVVRNVVKHLIHCRTCRTSLGKTNGRDDVITFLHAQRNDTTTPAVERVLTRTAAAGKQVLADLVYELANAFLLSDEAFARFVTLVVPPRHVDVVSHQLVGLASRASLFEISEADACRIAAQDVVATDAEKTDLRRTLVGLFKAVDGPSPRWCLLASHVALLEQQPVAAQALLETLVRDQSVDMAQRALAGVSLARAYMILDLHDEIDRLLKRADDECISGPILKLYGAASLAARGRGADAQKVLHDLHTSRDEWSDFEKRRSVLLTQYIASEIGEDPMSLARTVGAV